MAKLALKRCKEIGYLKLETDYYGKGWQNRTLSELVRYSHWGLNYLIADSKKIFRIFSEMEKNMKEKEKKVLLVTDKKDNLQILCNLIEGRFVGEKDRKEGFEDIKMMMLRKL